MCHRKRKLEQERQRELPCNSHSRKSASHARRRAYRRLLSSALLLLNFIHSSAYTFTFTCLPQSPHLPLRRILSAIHSAKLNCYERRKLEASRQRHCVQEKRKREVGRLQRRRRVEKRTERKREGKGTQSARRAAATATAAKHSLAHTILVWQSLVA